MAGLIDISIKNFKDILDDKKKLTPYLKLKCKVSQKSDGVKIVLVYNKDKEWEVHYKDKVIKKETFEGFNSHKDLKQSSGYAQYIHIFNHLDTLKNPKISPNTKFFCEFLMNKGTLTRTYSKHGALILLSVENNWDDKETEKYSKILKLPTPRILAEGNFEKDILPRIEEFMNTESVFGGIEEGIVLTFENGEKFKLLQPDQHDIETRKAKKANFYESPEYYKALNKEIKKLDFSKPLNWKSVLKINYPQSSKFTLIQQHEDALERALHYKEMLNEGIGLILGKFRVFTKEHENLITKAFNEKDIKQVVICVVTSKETDFSKELRLKMIKKLETKFKNLRIIEHSSGNLFTIFKKIGIEPLKIFCGTDRVEAYRKMTDNLFTEVIETKRDTDGISATKVLQNIDNKEIWDKSVSTSIKDMYNEIKSFYLK